MGGPHLFSSSLIPVPGWESDDGKLPGPGFSGLTTISDSMKLRSKLTSSDSG